MNTPDLTWMVEACGGDRQKMAELAIVLAMASLGQIVGAPDEQHSTDWILHYKLLISELERRVK